MRHNTRSKSFSRPHNQRVALIRNLLVGLVEHERISTTLAKAKELKRHAEKAITLGKKGSIADRRLLLSRVPHKGTVKKVFDELAPRFKGRNGGYTRIYRLDPRPGDKADMALIEFLDAKIRGLEPEAPKKAKKAAKAASASGEKKAAKASEKKAKAPAKKTPAKKKAAK